MNLENVEGILNDSITQLKRALFYESQYRNALVSNAISFYDVNLSKDLIENDFFYKTVSGEVASVLNKVGLSSPCKFSDFISSWTKIMIPETSLSALKNLDNLRNVLIEAYNKGKRDYTVFYWAENTDGRKLFLNQKFLLIQNEDNDICALSIVKDYTNDIIIQLESQHQEIERYAYEDPITKGYNYLKFKELVKKNNNSGAIISIDFKSFKIVNSICGIQKGDEVIKSIWEVILNSIIDEEGNLAAHINADHFIIFLQTFDQALIIQKVKAITYALSMISSEMDIPTLAPYFGITFWNTDESIELSYSKSVAALSAARERQKHNFAFFEQKTNERLFEEKRLIDSFEAALAKKDFKIWFQPKYNPITNKLVGAEALVRWQQENGDYLPPDKFIPLFERNNMIRTLDAYIFRNVCKQQKEWLDSGKDIVPVSINLSRSSLYYQNVVDQYKRTTDEVGIDTKYTPIEITESAAADNKDIVEIANDFYKAGFALHIDDFGSGYSSLASLNTLQFDTLKLDKSLVDFIGNYGGNRLIEHTIALAKELGLHVTAEGVEQENQVAFLKNVGCDSIQGFYFSKPVESSDFEKLLETGHSSTKSAVETSIETHIQQIKQSFAKPILYTFFVNLSNDSFSETYGSNEWKNETKLNEDSYQAVVEILTRDFVLPEYKQKYLDFMSRDKLVSDYDQLEKSRILEYKRLYQNKETTMRIISNLFKTEGSDDILMYFTVTPID